MRQLIHLFLHILRRLLQFFVLRGKSSAYTIDLEAGLVVLVDAATGYQIDFLVGYLRLLEFFRFEQALDYTKLSLMMAVVVDDEVRGLDQKVKFCLHALKGITGVLILEDDAEGGVKYD